jgi:hypothetical protein
MQDLSPRRIGKRFEAIAAIAAIRRSPRSAIAQSRRATPYPDNECSELSVDQRDLLVALLVRRNQFGNAPIEGCQFAFVVLSEG